MSFKTTHSVQYWESLEHLTAYAKIPKHLKAWRKFNQLARSTDAVGFYHETYLVEPDTSENVYINMPKFGLGRTKTTVPVTARRETLKQRLEAKE